MRRPVRRSALYAERIVSQNLIVVVSTLLAGALGFATQALLSHRLPRAGYGAAFTAAPMLIVTRLNRRQTTLGLDSAYGGCTM